MKNKYLTIFESLHSPVAVLTRENRIDTCNHAWKVLFGSTTPPGSDSYADSHPPPPTWLTTEIKRFVASERDEQVLEKQVTPPDRGKRHLSVRIKRMLDANDKFSGCVVILDDLTLQKQTEATLQETTILLSEIFNALEEAVFICTPDGLIVDANNAAQKIFGYPATELKNQTTELLHVDHDHFRAFTAHVTETLSEGENASFEYVAKRKNGDRFPVIATVTRLKREDDTQLGIVSILRDISAIKIAEEATRNSERLHGALELAGAVCHDLNQPLMAISGYAELILMDCPENAPHFSKLKKIVGQVNKLGDITKKLMHVTRYETKTYMDQQIIDIEKSSDAS
jgi:PAS domain S-box-containing protein